MNVAIMYLLQRMTKMPVIYVLCLFDSHSVQIYKFNVIISLACLMLSSLHRLQQYTHADVSIITLSTRGAGCSKDD